MNLLIHPWTTSLRAPNLQVDSYILPNIYLLNYRKVQEFINSIYVVHNVTWLDPIFLPPTDGKTLLH